MHTDELIHSLGFSDSPRFLRKDGLDRIPPHAHVLRRAFRDCGVRGVYLLDDDTGASAVPALYVASAVDANAADQIHRKVWNQNVVPFLLVCTPLDVRLYSGFSYASNDGGATDEERGVLEIVTAFDQVLDRLGDLRAARIDDGTIWRTLGRQVDSASRVDGRLLQNLGALGQWLRRDPKLDRAVAHALIGKFVYLRYLRDRNILSNRKLEALGVDPASTFGRNATPGDLQALIERVDAWLNGSVFPFPLSGPGAPTAEHIRRVAGAFLGDDPVSGQLHLDFRAYDFSFIPVETLSVVYEQFLSVDSQNRDKGAYYTPIHLVNFMLTEVDGMRRIEPGSRVLDPSCGSGAFLVQCYRWLVERHRSAGGKLRPSDLRHLLVTSIFGVDRDDDACQITALSLLLAMLDYLEPPDLQSTPQFKLPNLIGHNVFVGDFFDPASSWATDAPAQSYDWVVGNPPWIHARPGHEDRNRHARAWMKDNSMNRPVANNDVAEAFAWKAMEHVAPSGAVGLLLPAMTLFRDSSAFRRHYFQQNDVAAVANFTNLRRDLFETAETPAAALFVWGSRDEGQEERDMVAVFSPLVANQEANPTRPGQRKKPWVITADTSEIRQVSRSAIRGGDALPWKIAMWGGPRDARLLRSMRTFPTLDVWARKRKLAISAGLELREGEGSGEPLVPVPSVGGQQQLDVTALKGEGRVYALPASALNRVPVSKAFGREGRVELPLSVCRPPHVIVSGARTFAIFSSSFVVVPPRQIGIAGREEQTALLKALALYLNSDFAAYVELFTSPQGGIREGRSTLGALRGLPVPLDLLSHRAIAEWATLYDELAITQQALWRVQAPGELPGLLVDASPIERRIQELETRANRAVGDALRLTDEECVLVRDLVHVRRRLADGLVPEDVVRAPSTAELEAYAARLASTLDFAIDVGDRRRHDITVSGTGGMVSIRLVLPTRRSGVHVVETGSTSEDALAKIRMRMELERGQWLYFDRNLFLFDGPATYILKPLQRLWWTESQALADADHLVAEALTAPRGGAT